MLEVLQSLRQRLPFPTLPLDLGPIMRAKASSPQLRLKPVKDSVSASQISPEVQVSASGQRLSQSSGHNAAVSSPAVPAVQGKCLLVLCAEVV